MVSNSTCRRSRDHARARHRPSGYLPRHQLSALRTTRFRQKMTKWRFLPSRARRRSLESGPGKPRRPQLSLRIGWIPESRESQEKTESGKSAKVVILAILGIPSPSVTFVQPTLFRPDSVFPGPGRCQKVKKVVILRVAGRPGKSRKWSFWAILAEMCRTSLA